MCGRYAISHTAADLQALFDAVNPQEFEETARFNIAPTQLVPLVFRNREGERMAGRARWGLIPHWVKNPAEWRAATFNARSEDAASKPTFRQAFRKGRVLMPASGFYEWKREGSAKTPFFIRAEDDRPLALAALMDVWRDRENGERIVSCSVLTAQSTGSLEELHHRMPVIVSREKFDTWLRADQPEEALEEILDEAPGVELRMFPVSSLVNNTRNDDPTCIEPLT